MRTLCIAAILGTFAAVCAGQAQADGYPNMIGDWNGLVRVVNSRQSVEGQVDPAGAVITQVSLTLRISYQDEEVFVGESFVNHPRRAIVPVWGAIRSNGREGVFVNGQGGRGNLWFEAPTELEFCFANVDEAQLAAYCGMLVKGADVPRVATEDEE